MSQTDQAYPPWGFCSSARKQTRKMGRRKGRKEKRKKIRVLGTEKRNRQGGGWCAWRTLVWVVREELSQMKHLSSECQIINANIKRKGIRREGLCAQGI